LDSTGAAQPEEVASQLRVVHNASMHAKRRIVDDALYAHFVTFSVFHRRRLLDHDHPKRIVLGVLNALLAETSSRCVGFVLMPDHVHAVLWFPKTGQLSAFMHEWKWYREDAPNYSAEFGEGDRFWQPKYYAFEIFSRQKLEEKLTYLHLNPVRAGFVDRAVAWRWSSARWYELRRTVGVPIEWVDCE
jgi:putative transposase